MHKPVRLVLGCYKLTGRFKLVINVQLPPTAAGLHPHRFSVSVRVVPKSKSTHRRRNLGGVSQLVEFQNPLFTRKSARDQQRISILTLLRYSFLLLDVGADASTLGQILVRDFILLLQIIIFWFSIPVLLLFVVVVFCWLFYELNKLHS